MADAVRTGLLRYLGPSNVPAEPARQAHAVHPIAAVQYEYSLWRRELEADLLPTLRELGIAPVSWSPLGGGFLTGTVADLDRNDSRQSNPRYSGENLRTNRDRFASLSRLAGELGVTPVQLASAWLLHQGPDIDPIPGTRSPDRVDETARAASVRLDSETLRRIDGLAPPGKAAGATLL